MHVQCIIYVRVIFFKKIKGCLVINSLLLNIPSSDMGDLFTSSMKTCNVWDITITYFHHTKESRQAEHSEFWCTCKVGITCSFHK